LEEEKRGREEGQLADHKTLYRSDREMVQTG